MFPAGGAKSKSSRLSVYHGSLAVGGIAVALCFYLWPAVAMQNPFTQFRHGPLRCWQRPANEPAALTVVLVHGLGCSARVYTEYPELLDHLGHYDVIAPDLIGHGESEIPDDEEAYSMQSQAAAIFEMLMARSSPKQFVLVGHSMGDPLRCPIWGML